MDLQRLSQIMEDYQQDFETEQNKHPFVSACEAAKKKSVNLLSDFEESMVESLHDMITAAVNMGFVEGVQFAIDVMDIADTGKNKELLQRFLEIMRQDDHMSNQ